MKAISLRSLLGLAVAAAVLLFALRGRMPRYVLSTERFSIACDRVEVDGADAVVGVYGIVAVSASAPIRLLEASVLDGDVVLAESVGTPDSAARLQSRIAALPVTPPTPIRRVSLRVRLALDGDQEVAVLTRNVHPWEIVRVR